MTDILRELPTRRYSEIRQLRRRGLMGPAVGPCWQCGSHLQPSYEHCHLHDYVRGILCHSCNIQMILVDARVTVRLADDWRIAHWAHCPHCAAAGPWEPFFTETEYERQGARVFLCSIGQAGARDRPLLIRQATDTHRWMVDDLFRQREAAALSGLSVTGLRRLRKLLRSSAKNVAATRAGSVEAYRLPGIGGLENELRSLAEWAGALIKEREATRGMLS